MLILQSGSPPNKSPGQNFCQFTPSRPTKQRFACYSYHRQQQPCAVPLAGPPELGHFGLRPLERGCARPGQPPAQSKERHTRTCHACWRHGPWRAPRASSWCASCGPRGTLARASALPAPLHHTCLYSTLTLALHPLYTRRTFKGMHFHYTCTFTPICTLFIEPAWQHPCSILINGQCALLVPARPVSAAYIPNRSPHPGTKFLPR